MDGVKCAVFGVQGKAQRRGMVVPFQGVANNAAMRRKNRAIHPVAGLTRKVSVK
ncbi:MAG: hypothetical protein L0H37_07750 [Nitrosospira sp.]|nr:hypothetical protein [Nitrosospira sp.]